MCYRSKNNPIPFPESGFKCVVYEVVQSGLVRKRVPCSLDDIAKLGRKWY